MMNLNASESYTLDLSLNETRFFLKFENHVVWWICLDVLLSGDKSITAVVNCAYLCRT